MILRIVACLLVLQFFSFKYINGHGRLMDPVNRSSAWRYNYSNPQNWDDNQNYCGGANVS